MVSLLERSLDSDESVWPEFSHSQANLWDFCEKAWHYSYSLGWTSDPNRSNNEGYLVGSIVHDMMEQVYSPKNTETSDVVLQRYVQEFMQIAPGYTVELNRALGVTIRYFREYAPVEDRGHRILDVERYFRVPMQTPKKRNFWLHGYIDVVSEYDSKFIYTWDHKSSEGIAGFWTPVEARMDSQTTTYCAALREEGIRVERTIINNVNTYFYKNGIASVDPEKLFARQITVRTDREIDSFVREFGLLVDQLLDRQNKVRRSLGKRCGSCAFREPCLMELKGLSSQPVLIHKFVQKEPR